MIKMQLFVYVFGRKDLDATNDLLSVEKTGATNDVILTTFGQKRSMLATNT